MPERARQPRRKREDLMTERDGKRKSEGDPSELRAQLYQENTAHKTSLTAAKHRDMIMRT